MASEGGRKGIDDVQMINGEGRAGQGSEFLRREQGTGSAWSRCREGVVERPVQAPRRASADGRETTVQYLHLAVV
jgi:hypothetical protein